MNRYGILAVCAALALAACTPRSASDPVAEQIAAGNFTAAEQLLAERIAAPENDEQLRRDIFTRDSLQMVRNDFSRTREQIVEYVKRYIPEVSEEQLSEWERTQKIEWQTIDGERRYFRNAAPNLFRVDRQAAARQQQATDVSDREMDRILNEQLPRIIAAGSGALAEATPMRVHHRIELHTDKVQVGDTVRVWIPWPRTDVERQTQVELLASSDPAVTDPSCPHNTVYMERVMTSGEDIARPFSIDYRYTSFGQWFDMENTPTQPYDKRGELFRTYTAQRPPHIVFSDTIRTLTRRIVGDEPDPWKRVSAIFDFITANYPWASAVNYSLIPCIPQYVVANGKGDCGQVGLLFITMARCAGVPARWQSGLMFHPGSLNMHDWAEVYYEGVGWVPVDVSFGRNSTLRFELGARFFASGIDSYRMIANSDYARPFSPERRYGRNDMVDSQVGEVETQRGMLFNYRDFSYDFDVEYLDQTAARQP